MNNGRRYQKQVKQKVRMLRKNGWTHREIAKQTGIASSTASLWTRDIVLTLKQKEKIRERWYKKFRQKFDRYQRHNFKKIQESIRTNLSPYWKTPYSKEELLNRIRQFYLKNRRIPLKREFNMYREYQQRFGSWNNAILTAGFEPNPEIFSKKFVALDGHICDSFAEKMIDDWLTQHKISHKRNVPYQNSKMSADFVVGEIIIEYFGLAGEIKSYDHTIQRKRSLCQKLGLKLIEIYPSDLFLKDSRIYLKKLLKRVIKLQLSNTK